MDCLLANYCPQIIQLGQRTDSRFTRESVEYQIELLPLGSAVLGRMAAGDEAMMTRQDGEWTSITYNGINGWVHTDYITQIVEQTDTTSQPIEPTSTANHLPFRLMHSMSEKMQIFLPNGLGSFDEVNRMLLKKLTAIGCKLSLMITNRAGSIHSTERCHRSGNTDF